MPRKGTNIFKRKDGRWEARYIKSVSADGSKKYGSVYGKTFTEAKEKQEHFIKNAPQTACRWQRLTLSDVMHEWLAFTKNAVKKSTYQKYETVVRRHIDPTPFGNSHIGFISSETIGNYSCGLLENSELSAATINNILVIVGQALDYAENKYHVKKPKIKHIRENRKEMRVLSVSEQQILESYLYDRMNNYKLGVLIALYTGIRLGELCALQWDDIDDGNIVIDKTVQRLKGADKTVLEITEPKTRTSIRVIPIPRFLRPLLDQFRSSGSVLKNRNGKMVEPRLMQLTFEKYVKACGLPKTNFHALRHTFATRCVEAGFDIKSLSEILGHTDVKTTLNKYVHSSLEQKQKNMDLLSPSASL